MLPPIPSVTPANPIPNFQPLPIPTALIDGVFEGGGALGTAYVGALRFLQDRNVWFRRVAGNSAGSIMAAMIAVGFTAEEIEWLSSAYPNSPSAPNSLRSVGITTPVRFNQFLDLPRLEDLDRASRRRTFLWRWLKGQIIDDIGRTEIPMPTQRQAVDKCMAAIFDSSGIGQRIGDIPGARNFVRDALNLALAPLPDSVMRVRDLSLINTEAARVAFADTLWDALAANSAEMRLLTNLVHEGSIFEGKNALKTFQELFGRKRHNNPGATVLFKDLSIPLTVLAADIRLGRLVVYSSQTTPNFEVAEAVRQSMSIPLVFQPRVKGMQGTRRDMVDGGVFSNFPLWLMTAAGDAYWPSNAVDPQRLKAGFVLADKGKPPAAWGVGASPHPTNVDRTVDDTVQKLKEDLVEALVGNGMLRAAAEATLAPFVETELFRQIIGATFYGVLNTEDAVRQAHTKGLMSGAKYVDVVIPLAGYEGADFDVNSRNRDQLRAMWDRAWNATADAFRAAAAVLPTGVQVPANLQSPFK